MKYLIRMLTATEEISYEVDVPNFKDVIEIMDSNWNIWDKWIREKYPNNLRQRLRRKFNGS